MFRALQCCRFCARNKIDNDKTSLIARSRSFFDRIRVVFPALGLLSPARNRAAIENLCPYRVGISYANRGVPATGRWLFARHFIGGLFNAGYNDMHMNENELRGISELFFVNKLGSLRAAAGMPLVTWNTFAAYSGTIFCLGSRRGGNGGDAGRRFWGELGCF